MESRRRALQDIRARLAAALESCHGDPFPRDAVELHAELLVYEMYVEAGEDPVVLGIVNDEGVVCITVLRR